MTAGDTGDTPLWHERDQWCRRVGDAPAGPARHKAVVEWGEAAGGRFDFLDQALYLPRDIYPNLALIDLERFARDVRVTVRKGL